VYGDEQLEQFALQTVQLPCIAKYLYVPGQGSRNLKPAILHELIPLQFSVTLFNTLLVHVVFNNCVGFLFDEQTSVEVLPNIAFTMFIEEPGGQATIVDEKSA